MLHRICASGLVFAVVGLASRAEAQGGARATIIEWRAPAECPSQAWLEAEVQRLSGTELGASRSSISIQALVTRDSNRRWRVAVSTTEDGQSGVRELDAATCKELAQSTALLIGLLLRATAETPTTPIPTPPAPPIAAPPQPAQAAELLRTSRPRAPREPSLRVSAFAGPALATQLGIVPGLSPAFGVTFGAHLGLVRVGLSALYSPPAQGQAEENPAARGRFQLLTLGGSVCSDLIHGPPSAGWCVSIDWQRLTGEGAPQAESLRPVKRSVDFFTIGGGAFLSVCATKWLCLPLKLEALAPTRRPAYTFEDELVLRPALISGRLSLAAEFLIQ